MAAVGEIAYENDAAMVVLERLAIQEILFLRLDFPAGRSRQLEQSAACAVTGGGKDEVAVDNRSRNIGCTIGNLVVGPKELAVGGRDTNDAATQQRNVLA